MNTRQTMNQSLPLRINHETPQGQICIVTAQGNHYASTYDPTAAQLILAAPDLLNAAKIALQWARTNHPEEHGNPELGRAWGILEAAIQKTNQ